MKVTMVSLSPSVRVSGGENLSRRRRVRAGQRHGSTARSPDNEFEELCDVLDEVFREHAEVDRCLFRKRQSAAEPHQ